MSTRPTRSPSTNAVPDYGRSMPAARHWGGPSRARGAAPRGGARHQFGVALIRGGDPGACLVRRLAELNVTRDEAIDPRGLFACDELHGVPGATGPCPVGILGQQI